MDAADRERMNDFNRREEPMVLHQSFNRSGFSRFLNSAAGRVFRLAAGTGFLVVGWIYRHHFLGVVSMVWSVAPLTAGGFDICYISAVLGGPLRGTTIRALQRPR